MYLGINAGFGDPIAHEFPALRERFFTHVRQDLHHLIDPVRVQMLVREFAQPGAPTPLYIVRADQIPLLPPGSMAELLNEPNYTMLPEQYATAWEQAHELAEPSGVQVFVGSISNLDRDALGWLSRAWKMMTVRPSYVSVHRYPNTGGFAKAHKGFDRREDEVTALRQIIGSTPFAVTEFGYHTARQWRWGFWPFRWSEATVGSFCREEWQFWYYQGAVATFLYQLNDGPSRDRLDRYGIRTTRGQWKISSASHLHPVLLDNI